MSADFQEAYRRALGRGPEPPPAPEAEAEPATPRTAEEVNAWIAEQEEKYFGPPPPQPRKWRLITEPKRY